MNESIRLQLEIVITPDTLEQVTKLISKPKTPEEKRLENSRRAIYAGEDPPEDEALLLNSRAVAKLLTVCDKTVYTMQKNGEMPKPVKIGRAVRWGRAEIMAWVDAGCPPASEWKWPK